MFATINYVQGICAKSKAFLDSLTNILKFIIRLTKVKLPYALVNVVFKIVSASLSYFDTICKMRVSLQKE